MDVISLLKLLKDLLPPQVYERIAGFIISLMESGDAAAFERLAPMLREWARTHYPQYARLIDLILERIRPTPPAPPAAPPTPPPPPPPAPRPTPRWVNGARAGVYVFLAYLLIAAVADSQVDLTHGPAGTGACAINATPVNVSADESSYGPKSALKDALAEVESQCTRSGMPCVDPNRCSTCAPDAAVQSTEIKSRIAWYTAVVTAQCLCRCK